MRYTLRNIPKDVDRALRQAARKQGRSLNEVAIEALTRGTCIDPASARNHDFDFLVGTWVHDEKFDKAIADQRQIDPHLWK